MLTRLGAAIAGGAFLMIAGLPALAQAPAAPAAPATPPAAAATPAPPAIPAAQLGGLVAQTCGGCHGADYKGVGGMPTLRGRDAAELIVAMNEFRANQRYSTVMGRLSRGLTEAEISAVSTYLAALR